MTIQKFNSSKKISAFSLLEMLIVIGITVILVGLGAASYSTVQKKARDSKRRSDLTAIQNCMEQYYSVTSYTYQTLTTGVLGQDINCGSSTLAYPVDPLNITGYKYTVNSSSTSTYNITANLETDGSPITITQKQ